MNHVPIPLRMRGLDRDLRGYPIPVMVFRDSTGRPHFTINNEATRFLLIMDDQCSICGQKLLRRRWFVGGPLSAFHPNGTYIDPPLHRECLHYAMRVCPYLAMASYTKRIDARTIPDSEYDPHRIFIDSTQIAERPSVFVAVAATGQAVRTNGTVGPIYVTPKRPYAAVEFWKNGKQISQVEGRVLSEDALRSLPRASGVA